MITVSKTDFILYRECPNNVWVKLHNRPAYDAFEVSEFEKSLGKMGNEVEALARGIFPKGYVIERRSKGAEELTKKLIEKKESVIFQAAFGTEKYFAASDVLKWNSEAQQYDIYEIKMSSTEMDDDSDDGQPKRVDKKRELQYEYDLAFQANAAELSGISLNKKYLIRLNKKYIRQGELDFRENKLFIVEDKTEAVNELMPVALQEMEQAWNYLSKGETPPSPCPCYYKGRSSHCTAFSLINPRVPSYSVHDLNRIGSSKKLLEELLDRGILEIGEVPEEDLAPKDASSKPRKLNQLLVHKSQKPMIDRPAIRAALDALVFPLYFLDYETYPTAIPPYDKYYPYQHIVFQYSLHVLESENAELKHFECLVLDGEPSLKIAQSLKSHIGKMGSVISWFKNFENSRNRELANLLPEYKDFFLDVVERTYDLMDIVENQHYVHPGFKGRSSIKKVLPVVAPDFSYEDLGVKSGTDAIEAYRQITQGELTSQALKKKEQEMLEYCKLDTHAMVVIWQHLTHITSYDRV